MAGARSADRVLHFQWPSDAGLVLFSHPVKVSLDREAPGHVAPGMEKNHSAQHNGREPHVAKMN
jgi:hypothetical protein